MTHLDTLFFTLLKLGIGTVKATDTMCDSLLKLSMSEWRDLMIHATNQGVAAIAMDGLQKLIDNCPDELIAAKKTIESGRCGYLKMPAS